MLPSNWRTLNNLISDNLGQQPTPLLMATAQKKIKKKPPHKKILMPTHIAHICLCLPTHNATQRQSQKSAIANAFKTRFNRQLFSLHLQRWNSSHSYSVFTCWLWQLCLAAIRRTVNIWAASRQLSQPPTIPTTNKTPNTAHPFVCVPVADKLVVLHTIKPT